MTPNPDHSLSATGDFIGYDRWDQPLTPPLGEDK
jgi:hypothetical protein